MNNTWINDRLTERGRRPIIEQEAVSKLSQCWSSLEIILKAQAEHYCRFANTQSVQIDFGRDEIILRNTAQSQQETATITRLLRPASLIVAYQKARRKQVFRVADVISGVGGYQDKMHAIARKLIDPLLFPDLQD